MSIELLSGRILAPSFGNSIQVWGAVITVFMLSLALGYLLGGRLSVREPSLKKLSLILISTAAVTIPTVLFGDAVMDKIFIHVMDPRYGSLIAATALFFVPTLIGGMVSPYAVRLLVSESRMSGRHAGSLFFVSTFGSAAGTLITSFYLVLFLDVNQIFWLLTGVSTGLGVLTLILTALFSGSSAQDNG